ncbi:MULTISPECIES: DUF2201 family putative metallopeptidase [unclassified Bradyrhizobium]|uniref:vWA domain-containing protein n=1 Tax=unclassified Bradyrhizobium TaxID=2631580 RepID=UPI00291707FB|nr:MULTISPECIES: VWA-like domain-containing protein [unclassified Bradyrhizobium]
MTDLRMTRARSALIMEQPFYGSLAMRLELVEASQFETTATDGRRLFFNPAFLDELSDRQIVGVVAHLVQHCALKHHVRRGARDPERWERACDYAANPILTRAGFHLPDGALLDPQYEDLNAEAIYRILEQADRQQQADQQQDQQDQDAGGDGQNGPQGQPDPSGQEGDSQGEHASPSQDGQQGDQQDGNDPSGDGDQPADTGDADDQQGGGSDAQKGDSGEAQGDSSGRDPGRCGQVLDAAPDHDEAATAEAEAEWDIAVRQAVAIAKKQHAGTVPGFLQETVTDLADPRTDWRAELRRYTTPSSTKDYSWVQPNRRFMSQGLFTPGLISDGINHVAIVIDSSGSIDQDALRRFGGECQSILDEGGVDEVTVLFVDTRVNRVDRYNKGDQIDFTVRGRGGTAFSPAFAWLDENAPEIACAIYLTDLDCTDFGPEPLYHVLWAAYGDPRNIKSYAARLPFGECIDVQT